ncbi:uncharacterized protein LAJ45_06490 [Morchella importuna]|uniref:uncharacterized protein n=1 Tax=Morchella importuna TaxID=1174673 RepID=UPI001E8E1004|nr:uncharacterized protein LAJ45_06490 [Morchella importuna]KAH8149411.1 hypothetical protein LAJ45_06490 [Morchella importuna]
MADSYAALLGVGSPTAAALAAESGRRRPSLQQGPTIPPTRTTNNAGSSSKSRNRSSSATAAGTSYLRNTTTPTLNSSPSMATIASTSSTSSSYRGGLSRRDSVTDVARIFPQPPTGVGVTRENPIGDSPTASPEPIKTMASRKIMSTEQLREDDEYHGGFDMEDWDTSSFEDGNLAAQKAAADVGMRRMTTGITRKISDSKRIRPPSPSDAEEEVGGSNSLAEAFDDKGSLGKQRDQLVIPPGSVGSDKREFTTSASASTIQGYTSSSDEESAASSVRSHRSIGSRSRSSTSGASSKAGLPQNMSFTHSKKRGSKSHNAPPPLNLEAQTDDRASGSSTSAVFMLDSRRPTSRPPTAPPARSATASPSKSINASIRHKQSGGLEVPGIITSPGSPGSRLSSLASSAATQGPKSRSISATALNLISRSDSSSSTATTPHTARLNPATSTTPAGRTQKYLTQRDRQGSSKVSLSSYAAQAAKSKAKGQPILEPPLPDPKNAPSVAPAPASGMYWYKAVTHGRENVPVRAHTCTLVNNNIYVFGGCDVGTCFNDLHVFDADSMSWSKPIVSGDIPPPLRAMTCTAVGRKLVIFGGGDGPTYYNDIYVFDTITNKYTRPKLREGTAVPSMRRAHTACLYRYGIYVFGGGDGVKALNDVWRLDVSDLSKPSWRSISPSQPLSRVGSSSTSLVDHPDRQARPTARGYHTANMVGSKLIVYGGSDGDECFSDVWVFDVETSIWRNVGIPLSFPRLSHTATIVGSYLFVVGGHDGVEYSSEVLLLNLVTMQWDKRKVYGQPPTGRGYHGTVLNDSRLFVIGGFDGHDVFNDTYILELAVSSYYSQISHFSIEV